MRIDVVGLPASGKSTFAAAVSKKLHIPHIHLDRFWFESGGAQGRQSTPNLEEVRIKVRQLTIEAVAAGSWVSDGIYLHVQDEIAPRADVIVFLDIPLWQRILNHAQRTFFQKGKHEELDLWDNLTFFIELIKRNITSGPKLRRFIDSQKEKVIILRSRKEIDSYLATVGTA